MRNYKRPFIKNQNTILVKTVDIFISTALRHIAKTLVYFLDGYITNIKENLEDTTIRCSHCFKLCRYNFNNILTTCSHCRTWTR